MQKQYLQLFTELAHTTEIIAEQCMDLDLKDNDSNGMKAAETMRDDYARLYDRMREDDFILEQLTKSDYAKILLGAIIFANQLEKKLEIEEKVLKGYQLDIIPKLNKIINDSESEDDIKNMAHELFKDMSMPDN